MWETVSVYALFEQLTVGCVRQKLGVLEHCGESFGESSRSTVAPLPAGRDLQRTTPSMPRPAVAR
jgi:hypothetical protein